MCRLAKVLPWLAMSAAISLSGCPGSPLPPPAEIKAPAGDSPDSSHGDAVTYQSAASTAGFPEDPDGNASHAAAAVPAEPTTQTRDDIQNQLGLANSVVSDNPAQQIDVAGTWAGFRSSIWSTDLIVERDPETTNRYLVRFIRTTDLGDSESKRTAKFDDGILTLDRPAPRNFEILGPRGEYFDLFVVSTDYGDFLVPAMNAGTTERNPDLRPGLAYRRRADQ